MTVKVRGVYENGVVYLTDPLPNEIAQDARQEVEVLFEPVEAEEAAALAELDRIAKEIRSLGDPQDDTPEERQRRVDLFMRALSLVPPLTDEEAAAIEKTIQRPMSMFTLDGEHHEPSLA